MAAITMLCLRGSPALSAINNMAAPMAPGPAIKGVARGKTEISFLVEASSVSSSVVVKPPFARANTISIAINSNKMPPATFNAANEIPSVFNTISPPSAKPSRTIVAIKVPR